MPDFSTTYSHPKIIKKATDVEFNLVGVIMDDVVVTDLRITVEWRKTFLHYEAHPMEE